MLMLLSWYLCLFQNSGASLSTEFLNYLQPSSCYQHKLVLKSFQTVQWHTPSNTYRHWKLYLFNGVPNSDQMQKWRNRAQDEILNVARIDLSVECHSYRERFVALSPVTCKENLFFHKKKHNYCLQRNYLVTLTQAKPKNFFSNYKKRPVKTKTHLLLLWIYVQLVLYCCPFLHVEPRSLHITFIIYFIQLHKQLKGIEPQ